MRFFNDSNLPLVVDWYFVPDNRPVVPYAHAFYSRTYDIDEYEQNHLGEIYKPRSWRGGEVPREVGTSGLCGSREQWQQGDSVFVGTRPVWPGTRVKSCCGQPPVKALGGMAMGTVGGVIYSQAAGGMGQGGEVSLLFGTPCICSPVPVPFNLQITFTYISGINSTLDGQTFSLNYPSGMQCAPSLAIPMNRSTWINSGYTDDYSFGLACWEGGTMVLDVWALTTGCLNWTLDILIENTDPWEATGSIEVPDPWLPGAGYYSFYISPP